MRRISLYAQALHYPVQLQQVGRPKRRSSGRYYSELVYGIDVCPGSRDPAKSPTLVRVNQTIFTPMLASAYDFDLAIIVRMKRMSDPNLLG